MPLRERRDTLSGRVWRIPGPEDAPPIPDLDAPPFVGRLLRRRGVETGAEGELFLDCASGAPASARDVMQPAVERILRAWRDNEPVAVYGDYDVDGITSTVILHEALEQLGIESRWFIPNRSADGYGLHDAQLERLAAEGAKLIITADCGITALDTLRRAQEQLGLEFVVVDHHIPGAALPRGRRAGRAPHRAGRAPLRAALDRRARLAPRAGTAGRRRLRCAARALAGPRRAQRHRRRRPAARRKPPHRPRRSARDGRAARNPPPRSRRARRARLHRATRRRSRLVSDRAPAQRRRAA